MRLVEDIVREIGVIASEKKIKIDLENKVENLPGLWIDKLRLREVVENLIMNGIEYNIPPGEVKVLLDNRINNSFLIGVTDSGIGISKEDQKKLFTKFFRTKKGAENNTEGSGLGLYVVKSYVEGWGGKVSVESEEGKGSTFTITIPLDTRDKQKEVKKI